MSAVQRISIPIPTNFSFTQCLHYLDRGFDDCLYHLDDRSVSKLIQLPEIKCVIRVWEEKNTLQVEVLDEQATADNAKEIKEYVLDWFDLDRDLQPFYDLLDKNHRFKDLAKAYFGTKLMGIPNLFEALCWCIIGQQINLTFAYKLKRLLVEKYGEHKVIEGVNYYLFPSPKAILNAEKSELVEMKFSRQKIEYLKNVGEAFDKNQISKKMLLMCKSKEERMARLMEIKGIGVWTANYVAMKTLRDMTCITYGDSGLNAAVKKYMNLKAKPDTTEVDACFAGFSNWESYLNFYLWRTLEFS